MYEVWLVWHDTEPLSVTVDLVDTSSGDHFPISRAALSPEDDAETREPYARAEQEALTRVGLAAWQVAQREEPWN